MEFAEQIPGGLWIANAHQYGPGKTHIIDHEDAGRTYCGKRLSAVPGKASEAGKANCKLCLNGVENRRSRNIQRVEWERQNAERQRQQKRELEERRRQYHAYLKTAQWRAKSAAVISRAGGMCEGCGKRPATQAHHLTYDHVGDEFLWELRAVCRACHERFHVDRAQQ